MALRYRTDAVPFSDFANETGYNDLNPDLDDDLALRKELQNHYLTFNTRAIASQQQEKYTDVKSQFKSAIEQYDRTLSEERQPTITSDDNTGALPDRPLVSRDEPDSFAGDLFDATARGFLTGGANTISGVGILSNTVARLFDQDSEFGLDTSEFGERLSNDFREYFDIEPENEGYLTKVAEGIGQFGSILIGGGVGAGTVRIGAKLASRNAGRIAQTLGTSTGVLTTSSAQQTAGLLDRYIEENPNPEGYDQETVNGLVMGAVALGMVDSLVPGKIIGNKTVSNAVLGKILSSKPLKAIGRGTETAVLEGATEALQGILEDVVAAANIQDEELEDAIDTAFDNISLSTTGEDAAVGGGTGFAIGILSALLPGRAIGRVDAPATNTDPPTPSERIAPTINPITGQPDTTTPPEVQAVANPTVEATEFQAPNQFTFDGRDFTVIEDNLAADGLSGDVVLSTVDNAGQPRTITVSRDLEGAGRFLDSYAAQRNEQQASAIPEPDTFDYQSDPVPPVQTAAPAAQANQPEPAVPVNDDGTGSTTDDITRDNLSRLIDETRNPRSNTLLDRTKRLAAKYLSSGGEIKDSKDKTKFIQYTYQTEAEGVQRAAELYDAGLRESDVEIQEPIRNFKQVFNADYGRGKVDPNLSRTLKAALDGDQRALNILKPDTANQILNLRSEINSRSAQISVELEGISEKMQQRLIDRQTRFPNDSTGITQDLQNSLKSINSQLEAINNNLPSENSPLGTYVHRTYSIYFSAKDRAEAFNSSTDRYQNLLTYLTKQHLARNENLTQAEGVANAQSDIETLRRTIEQSGEQPGFGRDRQILSSVSALRQRKAVPSEVRQFLGEVLDPAVAYAATIHQQRVILTSVEMANNLEDLGVDQGWLTSEPNTNTGSLIPFRSSASNQGDNPGLMMLNGYYAPEWIVDGLKDHFAIPNVNQTIKVLNWSLGQVKLGKTVFSVGTQVRNMLSAAWQIGVNGAALNGRGIAESTKLVGQILANKGGNEYHAELTRLGVVGDGVSIGTIKAIVKDIGFIDRSGLFDEGLNIDQIGEGTGLKSITRAMARAYSASDDFPKIIGYEQNRDMFAQAYNLDRNDPRVKEEAARRVRDTYYTYSKVAKIIKASRSVPFGPPFISFPAEVYRTSKNFFKYVKQDLQSGNATLQASAGKRLISAAATVGITYNLGEILGQLAFGENDEEGRRRELMREFMKNGKFTTGDDIQVTRELPGGLYEMVNMSRYNPYAGVTDVIGNFISSDADFDQKLLDATFKAASPFWQPDVTLSVITDAVADYDNSAGSDLDKTKAFLKVFATGVLPTSVNEGIRIHKAYNGDLLNFDQSKVTTGRAVARALGASTDVVNPLTIMTFKANKLVDEINAGKSSANFSTTGRNQPELDSSVLNNQLKVIEKEWGRNLKAINILRELGYRDEFIKRSLIAGKKGTGGKLSKALADKLILGEPYPGLDLGERSIENLTRRTRFYQGNDAAVEAQRQAIEKRRKLSNL